MSNKDAEQGKERRAVDWAEKYFARAEKRLEHEYDGVLGMLPDWFPESYRTEFQRVRNNLLERRLPAAHGKPAHYLEPQTIKAWIDAYIGDGCWPEAFEQEIGMLAHWYSAFCRGQEAGLVFLLGEDQARTVKDGKQLAAGRAKAGESRAAQKRKEGDETARLIAEAEAELRAEGSPPTNKRIAKRLLLKNKIKLSEDHIRRRRKKQT